ncbi:MAG TPA: DUF624 domain-containing protein [Haloplasmataceae bacterium]
MFNFEKFTNSALYRYGDLLFKLILINLMVCMVSFLIVTLVPALVSGFECIEYYLEDREAPVVRHFFQTLKKNFKRHALLSLLTLSLGYFFLLMAHAYYVQLGKGWFYTLGFGVMIFVLFAYLMLLVQLPMTCVYYPKLKMRDTLKVALYMGLKHPLQTILSIVALAIPILIYDYLLLLFGFVGVSLYIYLNYRLNRSAYVAIANRFEGERNHG